MEKAIRPVDEIFAGSVEGLRKKSRFSLLVLQLKEHG